MSDPEVVTGCCRETKHQNVDHGANCQLRGSPNRHRRLLHVTEHVRTRKKNSVISYLEHFLEASGWW